MQCSVMHAACTNARLSCSADSSPQQSTRQGKLGSSFCICCNAVLPFASKHNRLSLMAHHLAAEISEAEPKIACSGKTHTRSLTCTVLFDDHITSVHHHSACHMLQEFNLGAFTEKQSAMRAVREFLQGLKGSPTRHAPPLRSGPSTDPSAPPQTGNTSPGGTSMRGDPDLQRSQVGACNAMLAGIGPCLKSHLWLDCMHLASGCRCCHWPDDVFRPASQ